MNGQMEEAGMKLANVVFNARPKQAGDNVRVPVTAGKHL